MALAPCANIPAPTRIHWHADGGPILHYDHLTREQVMALDLLVDGASITYGAAVRRLRDGTYQVRARIETISTGETAYKAFRERVLKTLKGGRRG